MFETPDSSSQKSVGPSVPVKIVAHFTSILRLL